MTKHNCILNFFYEADFERENKKGKFADICDLCSNPSTLKIVFVGKYNIDLNCTL